MVSVTVTPEPCETASAPTKTPEEAEFAFVKRGVPWRGAYARILRVGNARVVTLDPEGRRETNEWQVARGDLLQAWAERDIPSQLVLLHLSVAPWPHAPPWMAQRVTLAASHETAEAALCALAETGVAVDGSKW